MEEFLRECGQEHLCPEIEKLSGSGTAFRQIDLLQKMESIPRPQRGETPTDVHLLKECHNLSHDGAIDISALREGKVATLVLAGGAGSRLRYLHPKGCYPISPVKHKSFFQLLFERTLAAEKYYETQLRIGFVVAFDAQNIILDFFKRHDYFGFDKDRIDIIPQGFIPYYDKEEHWFLERRDAIACGSDGSGGFLRALDNANYYDFLLEKGIEQISVLPIDNPLADPFHAPFTSRHVAEKADVSILCCKRGAGENNAGLIVEKEGKIGIADYTLFGNDLPPSGGLVNTNIFLFSLSFLKKAAREITLPIRWVEKTIRRFDPESQKETNVIAFKGEKFVTDLIYYAEKVLPLSAPREETFAPLKSLDGANGVASVQAAIFKRNREIIKELTGIPTTDNIELTMDFYYPTEELRRHWQGRKLPTTNYVRPDA